MTINEAKNLKVGTKVKVHGSWGWITANTPRVLVGRLNDGRGFAVAYDEHEAVKVLAGYKVAR